MCDDININYYISNDYSICREERQYALYLSNVLRYYGKDKNRQINDFKKLNRIFDACGLDMINNKIIYVFYEATFMRDFFDNNRNRKNANGKKIFGKDFKITGNNREESFNLRLLKYCWINVLGEQIISFDKLIDKKIESNEMEEKNYGARNKIPLLNEKVNKKLTKSEFAELIKDEDCERTIQRDVKFKTIVRAMMNAKPDIAVIYDDNRQMKLLFLECKYLSKEDAYSYYVEGNNEVEIKTFEQTKVQGYIADFLCNHSPYMSKNVKVSEIMKRDMNGNQLDTPRSIKVTFYQSDNETTVKKSDKESHTIQHCICIKDLVELEKQIFT